MFCDATEMLISPRSAPHPARAHSASKTRVNALMGARHPLPATRLFDSHIFGPELMAVLDQLEVLQSKTHDLGTWLSIIAVSSAQPGDDPSGVGQRAFWVRVLLALRLAFKFSRKGFQEPLVGRIEGFLQHLICAAIASAHQLQDDDAGDSPGADEARHGVGVFNLRRLDVKTRRLQ